MEGKLKLTASSFGSEISISIDEDAVIDEVIDSIEVLLIGVGYHPDSIKRAIVEKAEGIEIEKE